MKETVNSPKGIDRPMAMFVPEDKSELVVGGVDLAEAVSCGCCVVAGKTSEALRKTSVTGPKSDT